MSTSDIGLCAHRLIDNRCDTESHFTPECLVSDHAISLILGRHFRQSRARLSHESSYRYYLGWRVNKTAQIYWSFLCCLWSQISRNPLIHLPWLFIAYSDFHSCFPQEICWCHDMRPIQRPHSWIAWPSHSWIAWPLRSIAWLLTTFVVYKKIGLFL